MNLTNNFNTANRTNCKILRCKQKKITCIVLWNAKWSWNKLKWSIKFIVIFVDLIFNKNSDLYVDRSLLICKYIRSLVVDDVLAVDDVDDVDDVEALDDVNIVEDCDIKKVQRWKVNNPQ